MNKMNKILIKKFNKHQKIKPYDLVYEHILEGKKKHEKKHQFKKIVQQTDECIPYENNSMEHKKIK
jgi:hypothetical protein